MKAVTNLVASEDAAHGVIIVAFAHGWKHNAAWDDGNVQAFRTVLSELQALEITNSTRLAIPPRKVIGVYLGWRGLSQTWAGLKELTFWERKRTAHAVGQGAVSEALVELEEIRKRSRIQHKEEESRNMRQPTMLIVVGHSFGGAVVYSAIAPLLQEHLIDVIDSEGKPIRDPERQMKTVQQGAATSVWCATSPQLDGLGGVYCENVDISPLVAPENEAAWTGGDSIPGVLPRAVDPEAAARLWEVSERLTA